MAEVYDLHLLDHKICFIVVFLALLASKYFITRILYKKILANKGVTFKTPLQNSKYGLSLYKFIFYISALVIGFFTLKDEDWVLNTDKLVDSLGEVPFKFKFYYIYEMCFYTLELLTIFYEPKKKDFIQMVLHHISTLVLMMASSRKKLMKFGLVIMPLHDVSDPILEFCKLENYTNDKIVANVGFLVFTCSFLFMRLFVYPKYVLMSAYSALFKNKPLPSEIVIAVLLACLQIMHIIWAKFILAVLFKLIKTGHAQDAREKIKGE